MKKLIKTDSYLLLIDEEAEIKGTSCLCYNSIKNTWSDDVILYQGSMPEYHYKGFQKIIAYYPLTEEARELDLPLLPNPFECVDIKKLAYKYYKKYSAPDNRYSPYELIQRSSGYIVGFEDGYKAAQSKGQYSLEDMKDALNQLADEAEYGISNFARGGVITKVIQSLSTQQLPKEFIPEYEYQNRDTLQWGVYHPFASSASNVRLKTITNSEGKEELVGTYKY